MLDRIINTAHIVGRESSGFVARLQAAVEDFQNDGYVVEVQYAHSTYAFSALLIARKTYEHAPIGR